MKAKSSKFRGVSVYARYRAQIWYEGRYYHIGWFKSEEEAAHAYDLKAIDLYGEKACPLLNFPEAFNGGLENETKVP